MKAIQWVRSLIFNAQMYVAMLVVGIVFLIPMALHPKGALAACKTYAWWVLWTARWMVGIKIEIRGTPPVDEVLVAAKHQSFMDVLAIFYHLPWGKFIMKRILLYAPLLGQYGYRLGCVPVHRGKRDVAIRKMVADVTAGQAYPGQLVIYPQGTRVAPGDYKSYKAGTAALYQSLGQPCIPVATNIGMFWPKRGVMRYPGTAVVEFLDPIAPGFEPKEFMVRLEAAIEPASNALSAEVRT